MAMPLWLGVSCVGARFAVQQASLTLNRIHGESSVLQRAPARPCFSGRAPKSEQTVRISVQLSGGGAALSSAIAPVDSMGYWHGCLATPLAASLAQHTVSFTSGPGALKASTSGVLVGDVVVCSGQSNMEKPVAYAFNGSAEAAGADAFGHQIRYVSVPMTNSTTPAWDVGDVRWKVPGAESLLDFSAVCWMYGRRLAEANPTLPLGLIEAAVGGTHIEAWSPPDALARCGTRGLSHHDHCDSCFYNGMIFPLHKYTVHHILWYQGEGNVLDGQYACKEAALISSWRARWHARSGTNTTLGFGLVQLSGYDYRSPDRVVAEQRWRQSTAAGYAPNTELKRGVFMAVTMDLADPASRDDLDVLSDVHPRFKEQVAERLWRGARAVVYGESSHYQGPFPASARQLGSCACAIEFKWVGGGALRLLRTDLFELRDAQSGAWSNASATLRGPTSLRVAATAGAARDCDAVRYAWWDSPCPPPNDHPGMPANATAVTNCSLYDVTGQPAPPFKINFR